VSIGVYDAFVAVGAVLEGAFSCQKSHA